MAVFTLQDALKLGVEHHQAGRLREAEDIYRQILAQEPVQPEAMYYLAVLANQARRHDVAINLLRRVIAIRPESADAYFNLGIALGRQGQTTDSAAAYRQAIALNPNSIESHNNLGNALATLGQLNDAVAAFQRAAELNPNYPEAYYNLSVALRENGQLDEALAASRRAIAIRPEYAAAHFSLGNALKDQGQLKSAIDAYRRAIALKPEYVDAHHNLSITLKENGQLDEATAAAVNALRLRPDYAAAHFNLGMALFLGGNFEPAWREYEWRWKVPGLSCTPRGFTQPLWDGGELNGRTILLHAEQGFGDAIQFIRYLPMVAARGGHVLVEVPAELLRLFRSLPGVDKWIARGHALPEFDTHCPLMSLGNIFGTTLPTIPPPAPLQAEEELVAGWRRRMDGQPAGRKVGLVWAGRTTHKNDRERSLKLAQLLPLASVNSAPFYSLQKQEPAMRVADAPAGMHLINWMDECHDFADTAALISQLDLVISVDSAVAHLAASLGKPVWLLVPFSPDWRWLVHRQDSPWYPTMRLFRQPAVGDWTAIIARIAASLGALIGERVI